MIRQFAIFLGGEERESFRIFKKIEGKNEISFIEKY